MSRIKSNSTKETSANPGFEQMPVCLWFLAKDKSGRAALLRRPCADGAEPVTSIHS